MGRRFAGVVLLTVLVTALVPAVPAPGAERILQVRHAVLSHLPPTAGQAGTSAQVVAPIPFSLVGLSVPEGTAVLLRTGDDTGAWSPWMAAEALAEDGDGPDPASGEEAGTRPGWDRMSEPLWVGEASRVQVRVLGATPGDAALRLDDVEVHLVDSLGLSRSPLQRFTDAWRGLWRGRARATAAASDRPPIVARADWGADESLRGHDPHYARATRAAVLHHTAGSNDYTRDQAPGVVRAIYAYHTRSLGWSDIGYNLLVDRYGTIYEGRAGGLERGVIGAHAGGFNAETFGVSIIGTFMSGLPPAPALDAAARVIRWKFDIHGIDADPDATVDMTSRGSTRYPEGHTTRLHTLAGHRDVSATACPGDALFAHLPALRQQVAAHPSGPTSPPGPPPLLPRLSDLGLPVPGLGLAPPTDPPPAPALPAVPTEPAPPAAPALPVAPALPTRQGGMRSPLPEGR